MNKSTILASLMLIGRGVASASADIIVDQPHDFVARSPSEMDTAVPLAHTADDFMWPGSKTGIESITVAMIVSFPNAPTEFHLDLHFGSVPSEPYITFMDVASVLT